MAAIPTNRDLYRAVTELVDFHSQTPRSLEEFLRSVMELAQGFRDHPHLTLDDFVGLLSRAFTAPAPVFDESWRDRYGDGDKVQGFAGWEAALRDQVVDLHEMAEQGILNDTLRYLGVDAPRGRRWYNLDPCTFLESAVAGCFGGWEPGDATGRDFVPGPVMAMGKDGRMRECDPRAVPRPVVPLPAVGWERFRDFLHDGQYYE